jgi:biotin-(acetyl-CoA carboxylase) ligase
LIGYNVEVKSVIDKLTENLKLQLGKNDEQIIDDWLKKLNLSGKKVLIVGEDGYWNVLGINNDGRLVLENRESGITKKIDDGNSVRYIID